MTSPRRLNEQKQEYRRDFAPGDIFTVQYPGLIHNRKQRPGRSIVTKLVIEFQTHLQLSRCVPLAGDLSEIRVVDGRVRRIKDNIVKEVEGLGAELKVSLLSKPQVELAEDGEINIIPMLPDPWVHFFVAVSVGRLLSKGVCIEPFLLCVDTVSTVWVTDDVDALLVAATHIFWIAVGGDRVRLT